MAPFLPWLPLGCLVVVRVMPGARSASAHVSKSVKGLVVDVYWGCDVVGVMSCCSCVLWAIEGLPVGGRHSELSRPRS